MHEVHVPLLLLLVSCFVFPASAASCPGALSARLSIPYYAFPAPVGPEVPTATLLTSVYYESSSNLLWAVFANSFALAAFNVSAIQSGARPGWIAAIIVPDTATTNLTASQGLIVDEGRNRIIITTNDPGHTLFFLNRQVFLQGGLSGNANAIAYVAPAKGMGTSECRGMLLDPATDGSFWIGCGNSIIKFNAAGNVVVNHTTDVGATFFWGLTIDTTNQILWASTDSGVKLYSFDILPSNDGLTLKEVIDIGDSVRGIAFDDAHQELYFTKRGQTSVASPPALVRFQPYNPGFGYRTFVNPNPMLRANGIAIDTSRHLVFATSSDSIASGVNNTYIHIYNYQRTGCECLSGSDCDGGDTCWLGICVSSACQECQHGNTSGQCVGTSCVKSGTAGDFQTQFSFDGASPHHRFYPVQDTSIGLSLLFERIEEYDPSIAIPIKTLDLLSQSYSLDGPYANDYTTQNFKVIAPTNGYGTITWEFSLLNTVTYANRQYGTVSFTQAPNSGKWSINLSQWPFGNKKNTLTLRVRLVSADGSFVSIDQQNVTSNIAAYTLRTQNSVVTLNLFNFATTTQPSKEVPVAASFLSENSVLLLQFPSFTQSLFYDPDVAIQFSPNSNSDSGVKGLRPSFVCGLFMVM